jgi:hypothetical protein
MTLLWVFNVWLYLLFVFNPVAYHESVAQGAPCWVQVEMQISHPTGNEIMDAFTPQPTCGYDPSNTNSGYYNIVRGGHGMKR